MRFFVYLVYGTLLAFVIFSGLQMTETYRQFSEPVGYEVKQIKRNQALQAMPKDVEIYLPLKK